jgi:Zn-dependent protease with chaperone function
MDSPSKLQNILYKVNRAFKAVWGGIASVFFFLMVILFWSADISSCIKEDDSAGERDAAKLKIIEVSAENARHAKIEYALDSIWLRATGKENPKVFIADSHAINAASFGSGRFLVWDGVVDLPDSTINAIFAHEIAHDILRHSKKAQDVKDLTDFVGDVLSVFGRADALTENT